MSSVGVTPLSKRPGTVAPGRRLSLADVTTKGKGLPSRIILHGVSGIGKTSFAACSVKPVFLMSRLETGIESLKDAGLAPESVGWFPECKTWSGVLDVVEVLTREEHDYKTMVIDVLNGCERMCHEHVCARDYNDKFASFALYQAGYKVSLADWRQLLSALDQLREVRRMQVILLAHTKVKNFKNPEGPDYDRYQPDLSEDTWSVTHGWSDMVLFANYDSTAKRENSQVKAKGQGGADRFIYTTRTAAWDAKHRHGLPEIISMGSNGAEAWGNFAQAMRDGNQAKKGGEA